MKLFKLLKSGAAGFSALTLALSAIGSQALAQEEQEEIEEIIVTGSLRSMPTEDVGSVFGFLIIYFGLSCKLGSDAGNS